MIVRLDFHFYETNAFVGAWGIYPLDLAADDKVRSLEME